MMALLAAQAARYCDRSVARETDWSTCLDRFPLPAEPPVTISSNHSDSTNVRCCTRPARLVPEGTVLRRASTSDSPVSLRRTLARSLSSAVRSSPVHWLCLQCADCLPRQIRGTRNPSSSSRVMAATRTSSTSPARSATRSSRACLGRSDGFQPGPGSLPKTVRAPEVTE